MVSFMFYVSTIKERKEGRKGAREGGREEQLLTPVPGGNDRLCLFARELIVSLSLWKKSCVKADVVE
jgi:hypothetical protein